MFSKRTCMQLHLILHYSTSSACAFSNSSKKTTNFLIYCNTQITKYGRNGEIHEAESYFRRMPTKNVISWTAMLTAYAGNGQIEKAREVFDEMPVRTVASWNAMITAYTRSKMGVDKAIELFLQMPERNAVSYATMLTGLVHAGKLDKAKQLYSDTPVDLRDPVCSNALISGYLNADKLEEAIQVFECMVTRDVVSWSSMVNGYCQRGRMSEARELFDRMSDRNVVTWTTVINGYMKMENFQEGFSLFSQMRKEGSITAVTNTLTIMIEACGRLGRYREGPQFHALALLMGFGDVFLSNSMILMYCRFGSIDSANKIFRNMIRKDAVSWNTVISGYLQAGDIDEAYKLFSNTPDKDVVSWTTMISGLSNKGHTRKSTELFELMPEKDDIAWTALISGHVNNGKYEESIRRFIDMLRNSVKPNQLTLSSVLSSSASIATLNQGLQIHAHVIKRVMESDLSIQNSLISMYSKCGVIEDSYTIFKSIITPNVVSFNSMITAFAQNGFAKEAISLFKKMKDEIVIKPNEITFLAVLSACTHVGLVQEGKNYFIQMKNLYKIEPGPDHYACMVDLFGRAGLLDEAISFINSMPFEPNSGVWGALLGASKLYLRLDLAKLAANKLAELEPRNPVSYVVLSDLYSISGKFEEEEQVRISKKCQGIRKNAGCSWIFVTDNVHNFLSGDSSHEKFDEIKSVLWLIVDDMKRTNYY